MECSHIPRTVACYTGVKQCTFHWLIANDIAQKEMVFNGLIIHHLIMNYIYYISTNIYQYMQLLIHAFKSKGMDEILHTT